jgi:hypothetical protein
MEKIEEKIHLDTNIICRKWITTKNGKKIFAKDYGLQAFCFPIAKDDRKIKQPNLQKDLVI